MGAYRLSPARISGVFRAGVLLGTVLAFAPSAMAGNQGSVFLGNEAAMTGGAVTANIQDAGAAWYNPAGLAMIERTSVDVSASAFVVRIYRLPAAVKTRLPDGSIVESDTRFTELVSVPSALTFVRKLHPRLSGAFAVFAPDIEDLQVSPQGQFSLGGSGRYKWSLSATRRTSEIFAGPAVGWKPLPDFRLGFGVFFSYLSSRSTRDFHSDYEDAQSSDVTRNLLFRERRIGLRHFSLRGVWGAQFDIDADWDAGVVVRGPKILLASYREIDEAGSTSQLRGGQAPVVDATSTGTTARRRSFEAIRPWRLTLGLARQFDFGSLRLEGDIEPGLRNDNWQVDRAPVWNVRVGGRFPLNDKLSFGGGLFTDRSAEKGAPTLGAMRIDYYGGSAGLHFRSPHALRDQDDPEGLVFSTTLAVRYARGQGEIGGLNFDPLRPPIDAATDVTVDELGLHIGSSVDF